MLYTMIFLFSIGFLIARKLDNIDYKIKQIKSHMKTLFVGLILCSGIGLKAQDGAQISQFNKPCYNFEIYTPSDIIFIYVCADSVKIKSEIFGPITTVSNICEALQVIEVISPITVSKDLKYPAYSQYLKDRYTAEINLLKNQNTKP